MKTAGAGMGTGGEGMGTYGAGRDGDESCDAGPVTQVNSAWPSLRR